MKKEAKAVLSAYGIGADSHWQNDVMALAQKHGFIVQAASGAAMLMTHRNQLEQFGESEYLRIQQMNGHCPKVFGYESCLLEDGSPKDCGSCWAAHKSNC